MTQQTTTRTWYLTIEGAIGVGKTTLARMLSEHFQTDLVLEVFEENPFLSKFYQSRARYAFQTQMFFLLSRYRQQKEQVPGHLGQSPLIADYMFAKDWLFAELNLAGDEWDIYQQIHKALAEQIPVPNLIVYLQASTDVLMDRIALRDRPYERDMDRDYIDALRCSYDRYFGEQQTLPVLFIDTNDLNFVTNPGDFQFIKEHIGSVLQEGDFQQQLPVLETALPADVPLSRGQPLADFQKFHVILDRDKGFNTDLYFNYLCLSEEIGELGSELAQIWIEEEIQRAKGRTDQQARRAALRKQSETLEAELADCMAYLFKLANYASIDLETAYLKKMDVNQAREWSHLVDDCS